MRRKFSPSHLLPKVAAAILLTAFAPPFLYCRVSCLVTGALSAPKSSATCTRAWKTSEASRAKRARFVLVWQITCPEEPVSARRRNAAKGEIAAAAKTRRPGSRTGKLPSRWNLCRVTRYSLSGQKLFMHASFHSHDNKYPKLINLKLINIFF